MREKSSLPLLGKFTSRLLVCKMYSFITCSFWIISFPVSLWFNWNFSKLAFQCLYSLIEIFQNLAEFCKKHSMLSFYWRKRYQLCSTTTSTNCICIFNKCTAYTASCFLLVYLRLKYLALQLFTCGIICTQEGM